MAVSRQDGGRTNQKLRTRRAIVDAAAELVRSGHTPGVAEAAERALVSRATAYRYFPTQQSLLIELQADATQPSPDAVLAAAGGDVYARVDLMTRTIARMVLSDEALFRNQLRVIQDLWFATHGDATMPVREGRRLVWIRKALEPVAATVPAETLLALTHALTLVVGVEPVLSLRDVCCLEADEIEEVLASTARSIVLAVLPPPPDTRRRARRTPTSRPTT